MHTAVTEIGARRQAAAAFRSARDRAAAEKDLERLWSVLEARRNDCWDRIEDAVMELTCVHEVPVDQILFHVKRTVAAEHDRVAEDAAKPSS